MLEVGQSPSARRDSSGSPLYTGQGTGYVIDRFTGQYPSAKKRQSGVSATVYTGQDIYAIYTSTPYRGSVSITRRDGFGSPLYTVQAIRHAFTLNTGQSPSERRDSLRSPLHTGQDIRPVIFTGQSPSARRDLRVIIDI